MAARSKATGTTGQVTQAPFLNYQRNELERFGRWITDWKSREYTYHL